MGAGCEARRRWTINGYTTDLIIPNPLLKGFEGFGELSARAVREV